LIRETFFQIKRKMIILDLAGDNNTLFVISCGAGNRRRGLSELKIFNAGEWIGA